MAYTIQLKNADISYANADRLATKIATAATQAGFLVRDMQVVETSTLRRIEMRKIRLKEAKEFCGQHAGPCVTFTSKPRPVSHLLEGDDWIRFNDVVNDVIDGFESIVNAQVTVFSTRVVKGRFIIRHPEHGRRIRWDYVDLNADQAHRPFYRPHNTWLSGREPHHRDQFKGKEAR